MTTSTTTQIDFAPGLFDEAVPPEEKKSTPNLEDSFPSTYKPKSFWWWYRKQILTTLALLTAAGAAAYFVINHQADTSPVVEGPFLLPTINQPKAQPVLTTSARSCYGDEAICTTAVTDRPADMMTSLVAMLPKAEKDRRYRVSVVIEELGEWPQSGD